MYRFTFTCSNADVFGAIWCSLTHKIMSGPYKSNDLEKGGREGNEVEYLIESRRDRSEIEEALDLDGREIADTDGPAQPHIQAFLHSSPRGLQVQYSFKVLFVWDRISGPRLELHWPVDQVHVHVFQPHIPAATPTPSKTLLLLIYSTLQSLQFEWFKSSKQIQHKPVNGQIAHSNRSITTNILY